MGCEKVHTEEEVCSVFKKVWEMLRLASQTGFFTEGLTMRVPRLRGGGRAVAGRAS